MATLALLSVFVLVYLFTLIILVNVFDNLKPNPAAVLAMVITLPTIFLLAYYNVL
jgi:hypothetical protein